jgi:hypothetical protein
MIGRTIRQALREGAAGFSTIDAAVFTTFTFVPEFFEYNVLPALFEIDDRREVRRRVQVNHRLLQSETCVLYDASTGPKGGGPYRYQRVGVYRPGGFFHPKLVILAGTHQDDKRPWIYVTAASANLTLSGWGKNQEVIGEASIGSNRQRLFGEVRDALEWLRDAGSRQTRTPIPAIDRCLAVMDRLGGSLNVGASTDVSFYFSPLHDDGFWPFLQASQTVKWDDLLVLSPYWGDVAQNIELANARAVRLIPAMLEKGKYGLGRNGLPDRDDLELLKLARLENNRLWHAKTYVLTRGDRVRVGVGSANFTGAGLCGGAKGNVEAMLVFETAPRDSNEFIPTLAPLAANDPLLPAKNADEGPEQSELEITVVYDWRVREYLVYFTPAKALNVGDYRLILPSRGPVSLDGQNGLRTIQDSKGPVGGCSFKLHYLRNGAPMVFEGLITEINVEHGDKPYFSHLSLLEILESWRLPTDAPPMPNGNSSDDEDPDIDPGEEGNEADHPLPAAQFDVLNLYDLYRSFFALRDRMNEAACENDAGRLLGLLVTRPDSIYRVAKQAGEDPKEHPVPRFLVLLECQQFMKEYRRFVPKLDKKFGRDLELWTGHLREIVRSIPQTGQSALPLEKALSWFEAELKQAWRP